MILRQLTQTQYDRFCGELRAYAYSPPLSPSYRVSLTINGAEYLVLLQPEAHFKIAVLHALEVLREKDNISHILITKNALLQAFLEILLNQGLRPQE